MEKKRTYYLTFAAVGLLLVLVFSVTSCRTVVYPSMEWYEERFEFESGPYVYVFRQPKLVVFLGDGGDGEVFDRVASVGHSHMSAGGEVTVQFFEGNHVMVISLHGEQYELTLADGRTFTLDGKTPFWLRCKSDGTVVKLDELPDGFVEFFESPPDNPGFIETIESYPDAFRK